VRDEGETAQGKRKRRVQEKGDIKVQSKNKTTSKTNQGRGHARSGRQKKKRKWGFKYYQ
jgi:hypothetical protein